MKTNMILLAMFCALILSACGGGGSTADGKPCGNCDSVPATVVSKPTVLPDGANPNASTSKTILGGALKCIVTPPMSQICTGA